MVHAGKQARLRRTESWGREATVPGTQISQFTSSRDQTQSSGLISLLLLGLHVSLQSDWHDAALTRPCLFDMGASIDQISTYTPAPFRYRRPGLDTASLTRGKYRFGKMKSRDKKRYKRKNQKSKLTVVTMQPPNGLIEIDEPRLPPFTSCKSTA